ncbi:transposase, partial [Corynebacterium pyruviciproducens]|uniref:transposase n=1 Tax=Corynebacterium pyruviciproducens TaxID=598660 RepID=UPI003B00F18F
MHFLGCVSRRSSGKKTAATVQNASRLKLNDDPGSTPLNHKRVARIMKDLGLCGYTRRRRV